MEPESKVCSRCLNAKPITEFRQAKATADGMHPWCRPCDTEYAREHRRALRQDKPDRRLSFRGATWTPPSSVAALAYLAGIIDGEGTIVFQEKPGGTRHYRVAVIMTSEETIRWIGQWGGTVAALPPRVCDRPRKPQWIWRVTGHSNVRVVLTAVMPYMITKKNTAAEALAYIATRPGAGASCPMLDSMVLQAPFHASAGSRAQG
jgi:hypothetical protein